MTIGDILDKCIQLYRSNFSKFIGIVLLVKGPYIILSYIIVKLVEIALTGGSPEQTVPFSITYGANLIVKMIELISIGPVLIAAMTMAISERFLNRDIGIIEAYKRIWKRFLPLLGTIIITGLVISSVLIASSLFGLAIMMGGSSSGSILVIIGGVLAAMLWTWYAFIPQTVVLEGEGGISAMKRSKYLVKGDFLKVFILLILVLVAIALIMEIISFGIIKALFFFSQHSAAPLAEGMSNVISVLFEPFRIAAITLLYYDLRIRKEGFDLEIMAEELEANI